MMKPTLTALFLATVLLVGQAAAQVPPQTPPPAQGGEKDEKGREGLGLKPAFGEIEVTDELREAGKVQPLSPGVIEKLLPETMAGLKRTSMDGQTDHLGPVGITRVSADYGNDAGTKSITLQIVDRGGLQQEIGGTVEIPPIGSTTRDGAMIIEGLSVGGFPALARHIKPGLPVMLYVEIGSRIRLNVRSNLAIRDLVHAIEALDLHKLVDMTRK